MGFLPDLKKLAKFCSVRVLVLIHPSLCRALKLTCPMDVGDIGLDGWMTSVFGQKRSRSVRRGL